MSASSTTTVVPQPRTRLAALPMTSGKSPWPDPEPAARRWLENLFASETAPLHRVEHWERAGDGLMHSRCGQATAALWVEPRARHISKRSRCLHCEDADDYR